VRTAETILAWLIIALAWLMAVLNWLGIRANRLAARELDIEKARARKRILEWECPEIPGELRVRLADLRARNEKSAVALQARGMLAADYMRQDLGGVPDIVLGVIVLHLVEALHGVEGIACREQLDALDLVRMVFTAAAADLAALELETTG